MRNLVITFLLLLMAVDFAFFCHCKSHNPHCPDRPGWLRRLLVVLGVCLSISLWLGLSNWLEIPLLVTTILVWRKCCWRNRCNCEEEKTS